MAPSATAVFSAAARLADDASSLSTSRIPQSGQAADTMSRSSEISVAQPSSGGSGLAWPVWSTLRKQPFAVVQAGSPKVARYTARSASALTSSPTSTTATVWFAPPVAGRPYAERRSAGP